jgi:hypothetical protein
MYKFIISILFLILFSLLSSSQSGKGNVLIPADSTKENRTNGDNGSDTTRGMGHRHCYKGMRRDRFIDKDGDGVCDERESNIGIRHRHGWETRDK